jgi:hypothetical protein
MAQEFPAMIEAEGVSAQEPARALDVVGVGGFEHEVKMVAHEAPGVELKAGFVAGFGKGFEKIKAVDFVVKDVLRAVAAIHEVVDGTGILDAQLSGHGRGYAAMPGGQVKGITL